MGSCLSKKTKKKSEKKNKSEDPTVHCSDARRSPPPEEEEAVVKEVLLETPKPARGEDEVAKKKTKEEVNGVRDDSSEEASSEIRSLSESVSVSTTVTERKEIEEGVTEEEEVQTKTSRTRGDRSAASKTPQKRNHSVSGEFPLRRDQRGGGGGGGGGRRSSPSPVRRSECGIPSRSSSGRAAGLALRTRTQAGSGYRRDPGERSGRRSVSPATKGVSDHRGGVSRNTSMRGNGRASPHRATSGSLEDGLRRSEGGPGEEGDNKESLENPLVSLECFIFL